MQGYFSVVSFCSQAKNSQTWPTTSVIYYIAQFDFAYMDIGARNGMEVGNRYAYLTKVIGPMGAKINPKQSWE